MAILLSMARLTIKATYALDPESVAALEGIARRWRVSKSEALRRAIHAASTNQRMTPSPALAALDKLQATTSLDEAGADRWADQVRSERQATGRRRRS